MSTPWCSDFSVPRPEGGPEGRTAGHGLRFLPNHMKSRTCHIQEAVCEYTLPWARGMAQRTPSDEQARFTRELGTSVQRHREAAGLGQEQWPDLRSGKPYPWLVSEVAATITTCSFVSRPAFSPSASS